MGSWTRILRSPSLLEPVLRLPPECSLYILSLSADCSFANREANGGLASFEATENTGHEMVLLTESRAFQPQGACFDHYLCKFRLKLSLRCKYRHHCHSFLWHEDTPPCSYVADSDYTGKSSSLHVYIAFTLHP